jgi:hypothetical protein
MPKDKCGLAANGYRKGKIWIVVEYCVKIKKQSALRAFFFGLSPKNVNNLTP